MPARMPVCLLLGLAPLYAADVDPGLSGGPVRVEIFEKLTPGHEFELAAAQPTTVYTEPAFAFVRLPLKYSPNALPLDRSVPFVLRASYTGDHAGSYRLRLRARGAAVLLIDGKEVARTKPQPPNTSGDDPVPPPVVKDETGLRAAPYPHQDVLANMELTPGKHEFVLVALIGGKGLYPSPGELAVGIAQNGKVDRLLGPAGTPL